MASGIIYGSTGNQYIDSKIEWSSTANNSANTSSVTAKLYYKRNNTGFQTYGPGSFSVTIDGQKQTASATLTITESAWVLAMTATKTVSHNGDGTKAITISATGSIPSTTLTSTSCSGRVSLDTIPRASTITSAGNITLGNACNVKWTPASASFRYKVNFSMGGWSYTTGAIHPGRTSLYTYDKYAVSLDAAGQIPNGYTGTMTATLYTYSDSDATTQVGSASSKTFTVTVPNNTSTKPSVTMSLAPVSSLGSAFAGLYVQGKSRVKASFSGSGKYGATIASYGLTVLGKGYASPFQTEHIQSNGTVAVNGRAKDSRGFVTEVSHNITVIPYSKPKIVPASGESSIVCARCDSSGNLTESGTYLKIKAGRSYSKVMSGSTQKNFCLLRYRYKAETATNFSAYTTLLAKDSTATDYVDITLGNVVSSTQASYLVELSAIDDVGDCSVVTFSIPTDSIDFHLKEGGNGAAFGKYAERDKAFEIASDWDIYYKGDAIEKKFYSLRGNTKIPSGADLNDYKTPDVYAIEADAHAANIANMPPFKRAGLLIVYAGTGQDDVSNGTWRYIVQEYRSLYTTIPTYRRRIDSNAEGVWTYETWQMEKGLDTGWIELAKSSHASTPSVVARDGAGCFYRVINENHVYVRFNCAFSFSGSSVNLNSTTIPEWYRPKNNAMALLPVNDRGIARASVASDGYIYVNYVQNMATASTTTSFTVTWIDGYIDYWL